MLNRMRQDTRYEIYILFDGTCPRSVEKEFRRQFEGTTEFVNIKENDINSLGLNALLIMDPYSKPCTPYSEIKVPIIYKEYGVSGIEVGSGNLIKKPAYKYADLIITDNEYCKKLIKDKYGSQKNVIVGSPAFDYVYRHYEDDKRFKKGMIHVLWTPHHSIESKKSYDNIIGGTYGTFLTYKDYIVGEWLNSHPEVVLHIKFHPLLGKRYNEHCKSHGIDNNFKNFTDSIKDNKRIFIHDHEDYHSLFMHSDIILNDSLSFILEWLPTDKPMILLRNDNSSNYSPYGMSLIEDCCYQVRKEIQLEYMFSLICRGYDYKNRESRIRELYISEKESNSDFLVNIIHDLYGTTKGC